MVVDRGTGTGRRGRELRFFNPPPPSGPLPPPPVAPQGPGPLVHHRSEGGGDSLVRPAAGAGMCGGSTRFFLPSA